MDMELKPATRKQVTAIYAEIKRQGLQLQQQDLIAAYTSDRTDHAPEMSISEARALISHLYSTQKDMNVSSKLMDKLFAMAHEIGWIPKEIVVEKGKLVEKKNYDWVHDWVIKYGYLKKPLREYTYKELPKLVSIFETKIYDTYIQNLSSQPKTDNK